MDCEGMGLDRCVRSQADYGAGIRWKDNIAQGHWGAAQGGDEREQAEDRGMWTAVRRWVLGPQSSLLSVDQGSTFE